MLHARKIVDVLRGNGYLAVFAGGCVRDMLLGLEPQDYDIATNATPEVVEGLFPKTVPVGKSFGVIIVVEGGTEYEVATFRRDGEYTDGRRPDSVTFGTMEADAQRRDLTINGMFFDPVEDKIIDFVGGKKDLVDGVIRFIGCAHDRINEDKLRMLRAIRFAAKFGYTLEPGSLRAIEAHGSNIHQVSKERIADELVKMLRLKQPSLAVKTMQETGLLLEVLPEINDMVGVEQPPEFHPEGDVFVHTMLVLDSLPENASDELRMAALFHDVGKPKALRHTPERVRFDKHERIGAAITELVLRRLKFSNDFIGHTVALVANHMKFMHVTDMRISRLKRFIGMDRFDEHKALHRADCLGSHGGLENLEFLDGLDFPPEEIKPPRLITGHDLINMGVPPGPGMRDILTFVEDEQLEGRVTSREEALESVKTRLGRYTDEDQTH